MAAIRLHHDLDVLGDTTVEPEVQTLVAASLLAEHLMHRDEGVPDSREWAQFGPRALQWLQVSAEDLDDPWLDELGTRLDRS